MRSALWPEEERGQALVDDVAHGERRSVGESLAVAGEPPVGGTRAR